MDTKISKRKANDYERSLGFLIHDVARLMRVTFDREVREVGLTRAQWFVLAHIIRNDGQTQKALGEDTDMEKAPLGKLLDRMEEGGWIKRRTDPRDRRAKLVCKTSKVDKLVEIMETAADRVDEKSLASLNEGSADQLIDMLIIMKNNLLKNDKSPSDRAGAGRQRNKGRRGNKKKSLKRPINPMPTFISEAIERDNLERAYGDRPSYQRNDYIDWVMRAKRAATRQKRLDQMLDELRRGDIYMKMKWPAQRI